MGKRPLEILLDYYCKAPSFNIQVIKDYERRNYIQAETIYNKLNDEKVLRYICALLSLVFQRLMLRFYLH
jgi:hypothetical protein